MFFRGSLTLYSEGVALQDKDGNSTAASVEKYKQAVALYPYFALPWHYMAMWELRHASNPGLAMRIEQKLRLLIPDDTGTTYALHGIALVHQNYGQNEIAKTCFREAIQFMPGNDYPYLRFAELLREEERYNEAVVVLEKGLAREELENDISTTLAWTMWNIFVYNLKDFHGAEFIAKKHLSSNRDFYPLIALWGETYAMHAISQVDAGHYFTVELEKMFLDLKQEDAQILAQRLKEGKAEGQTELFYGKYVSSTQPFLDALQEYWRDTALLSKGQALIDVNEAIALNGDEPRYLILKARILSGNIPEFQTQILSLLKKAKTLDSFFYDGHFLEGEVYRIQGKYDAARTAYRKVPIYHVDYLKAQQGLSLLTQ